MDGTIDPVGESLPPEPPARAVATPENQEPDDQQSQSPPPTEEGTGTTLDMYV